MNPAAQDSSASDVSLVALAGRTPRYRPFLFTKRAERDALNDLDAATLAGVTPVFVVTPRDLDFDTGNYKKPFDAHLAAIAELINQVNTVDTLYLDVSLVEHEGPLANGMSAMEAVLNDLAPSQRTVIPLVDADSSTQTLAAAAAAANNGVAVRLTSAHWPSGVPHVLSAILATLGVSDIDVDLILDCGDELGHLAVLAATSEVAAIASGRTFRSVTFAGAAWPKNMPAGAANHEIPRDDFAAYVNLATACASRATAVPDYADWAVAHPDPSLDVDPRILNIAATMRYTCVDKWVLGKGGLYKGNGGKSKGGAVVRPMLVALTAHSEYRSVLSCEAERWIDDVVAGRTGPGNPGIWRRWALVRHLTLTVKQLST
ncbi:MAG TPA: hypothetical protein VM820_07130 [Vicinamibacterales bacterium]|jgi:hypothetical protein|nr:hypothetical protein [Vicinamibacterales bacterium]